LPEARRDVADRQARRGAAASTWRKGTQGMSIRNRFHAQGQRPEGGRQARAWSKPWAWAALACCASYVLLLASGAGRFRSEFLGISLVLGAVGAILLVGFRVLRGPVWLHWLGAFCLHWLFAAYLIAFLAV
jgi:hypothetical protein